MCLPSLWGGWPTDLTKRGFVLDSPWLQMAHGWKNVHLNQRCLSSLSLSRFWGQLSPGGHWSVHCTPLSYVYNAMGAFGGLWSRNSSLLKQPQHASWMEVQECNISCHTHTHVKTPFNHQNILLELEVGSSKHRWHQDCFLGRVQVCLRLFLSGYHWTFKKSARAVKGKYNIQYQRNIILCVVFQKLEGCDFIRTLLLQDHRVICWHFELHLNPICIFKTTFMFHHKLTLDGTSHYCHRDCTWT